MMKLRVLLAALFLAVPGFAQAEQISIGGGGGTPGGSTTQVQYNNAGVFGGISGATSNGTALTLIAPILGTPASGTLTNATGLPISSGVSGLGTGVAAFLATPSSANLLSAMTTSTGSGSLVFATTPTLVTPVLGLATGTSLALTDAANPSASTLSLTGATALTTSQPLINGTQTWNAGGVTFTGMKLNITATASAAASLLMDLQVASTSQWSVTKAGVVTQLGTLNLPAGSTTVHSIDFGSSTAGLYSSGGGNLSFVNGTTRQFYLSGDSTALPNDGSYRWSSTAQADGVADVILARDAANTLALRNGVNAQTLRVYGTFTDASNGDYFSISKAAAGAVTLSTVGVGTGTGGDIQFSVPVTAGAGIAATSVAKFAGGSGHLLWNTDNTYDIGASGATRPRTIYAGTNISAGGAYYGTTYNLGGIGGSNGTLSGISDGVFSMKDSAGSSFGRLQFGGTTSSFPALKRSSAILIARLADDSADATFQSGQIIVSGIATDATHTDSSVCQDTTSHQFYAGSGAAGICLGTSSLRFKDRVAPLTIGLDAVMHLDTISYHYKPGYGDPTRKLYGFAAEQVSTVIPELVGLDTAGRPNSVDWAGMVPVLVRAMQEQQAEIEQLKKRIH